MIKLTDLQGSECLPKEVKGEGNAEEQPFSFGKTIGNNEAVSSLSSINVNLDIEELVKIIEKQIRLTSMDVFTNPNYTKDPIEKSKRISKALSLEMKRFIKLTKEIK